MTYLEGITEDGKSALVHFLDSLAKIHGNTKMILSEELAAWRKQHPEHFAKQRENQLGEFTDVDGTSKACRLVEWTPEYEEEKDLVQIEYVRDGQKYTGMIGRCEFRPDTNSRSHTETRRTANCGNADTTAKETR